MLEIHEALKVQVRKIDEALDQKYGSLLQLEDAVLRTFLEREIGLLQKIERMPDMRLKEWEHRGGMVGVDGSVNRAGNLAPHYLDIFRAVAKSTRRAMEPIVLTDARTPLLNTEEEGNLRERALSDLEVRCAIEAVEKWEPAVLMMDGGLLRYRIISPMHWERLRELCETSGTLLLGVIKDIKTSVITARMRELNGEIAELYDRELLFGRLEVGEVLLIWDEENRKNKAGFSSAFLRSSSSPAVIGIDMPDSQGAALSEMASLILALTPEGGRGVPLWLDIVDAECKMTDELMEALLQNHMSRRNYERFFISERDRR